MLKHQPITAKLSAKILWLKASLVLVTWDTGWYQDVLNGKLLTDDGLLSSRTTLELTNLILNIFVVPQLNVFDIYHYRISVNDFNRGICLWYQQRRRDKQQTKLVLFCTYCTHYNDVIMSTVASQIASGSIVCPTVGADQGKQQSSASLAFVRVNSPHKGPVTRKMFPFDDVIIMLCTACAALCHNMPDGTCTHPLLPVRLGKIKANIQGWI